MGQTLSSPATDKHTETGGDERYSYAVSEMQGWRISMEDAHTTVLRLDEEAEESNTFFAVYDGHGGGSTARFAGVNVHKRLVQEESYKENKYDQALKRAFLGTDEDMLADPSYTRDPSGCTAVAALITKDKKIYVANAGDSRIVLGVKGQAKPLSYDHKPQNDTERSRIMAAGGYIEFGRVNGNLALARALGDFEYKKNYSITPEKQIITADPDVIAHDITDDDEFLVLACDGIWDCLSSQQVIDVVRLQIYEGKDLPEICENICELCLAPDTTSGAGIGCDNMTVMIVAFLNGMTKPQWYDMIRDRVDKNVGYRTPREMPQIYTTTRLLTFRARRDAQAERDKDGGPANALNGSMLGGPSAFSGLQRVLGSTGGISFHPGSSILSDAGTLMFEQDDSDEDDSGDDMDEDTASEGGRTLFGQPIGSGRDESPEGSKSLKEQLDELEKGEEEKDSDGDVRIDDADDEEALKEPFDSVIDLSDAEKDRAEKSAASPSSSTSTQPSREGEAPPPPHSVANGDANPAQLKSQPGGDEASDAVKADGLMDKSEDPMVV
ncbi:PP2C-domain-containing protein [Stereum hirsutum FP-91666 SS1]|uniref:PP2C-domain-containing protein n=1 Tax=Stereum hirsutum (strain FP-91666) TaxID=721885 RepID=UPI000444A630|nr:PP2C-domain-containing protein [Stereum hirsutum FP-91666 SS1]EIM86041.1 PP2C-domain-containing protein [Stereum hirsutum FP-91666 SS1]